MARLLSITLLLAASAVRSALHSPSLSLGTHLFTGDPSTLPASVDWCARGACNAVQDENQHGCFGACWAFSAAAAVEAAHYIHTGSLVKLSEQMFVDCAGGAWGNQGCAGGLMDGAFRWAAAWQRTSGGGISGGGISGGGISGRGGSGSGGAGLPLCVAAEYPYYGPTAAGAGTPAACAARARANCTGAGRGLAAAVGVKGHVDVAPDEASMMSALATQGPLAVAVHGAMGDENAFQLYRGVPGEVLSADCGAGAGGRVNATDVDHGVLLVGYGVATNGTKVRAGGGERRE
jgi:hypothetical protein